MERTAAGGDNTDPPSNEAPGIDDAIRLVKKGDIDAARDICPPEQRDALEAIITSRENAQQRQPAAEQQRPSARRTRTSATAPE
jgi:hypothetical protein